MEKTMGNTTITCYSPKPQSAYAMGTDWVTGKTPEEWNLVWLSIPEVDQFAMPGATCGAFPEEVFARLGTVKAEAFGLNLRGWLTHIMGRSAVQFVEAFYDGIRSEPTWERLGGQAGFDTMLERAYAADGMAEVYKSAQAASNVILVNFRRA